jgi:hypothetical protein
LLCIRYFLAPIHPTFVLSSHNTSTPTTPFSTIFNRSIAHTLSNTSGCYCSRRPFVDRPGPDSSTQA